METHFALKWLSYLYLELARANGVIISFFRNPDAPAPEGAPAPPGQTDSDDDMSSTSSFTDED